MNKSPVYFSLDAPDTKSKLVTIEDSEEIIQEKKAADAARKEEEEKRAEQEKMEQLAAGEFDEELAEDIYRQSCASCHGGDLEGGAGPALGSVGSKLSDDQILDIIENGKGPMPAGLLNGIEAKEIAAWLASLK